MKILENGIYREATKEELDRFQEQEQAPYKERVVKRIRERYSVDDEIAIIRQKDTKVLEFIEYNEYVEKIKREEKEK